MDDNQIRARFKERAKELKVMLDRILRCCRRQKCVFCGTSFQPRRIDQFCCKPGCSVKHSTAGKKT